MHIQLYILQNLQVVCQGHRVMAKVTQVTEAESLSVFPVSGWSVFAWKATYCFVIAECMRYNNLDHRSNTQ